MEGELKQLAVALYDIGAVKFGEFVTKVGLKTPVYFDFRVVIAHPKIMTQLATALRQLAGDCTDVSQICGVPYSAVPLATLISVDTNTPMLMKRKEAKTYGAKKLIEGSFNIGDHCIIIEDVVTSGSSILETVEALRTEGLKVTGAFVILDREQGGKRNLENDGVKIKSLYTVTKFIDYLLEAGKVTPDVVKDVTKYLKVSQVSINRAKDVPSKRLSLTFSERAKQCKNAVALKLFQLMETKESTICLAVDLCKADAILELADLAGPHIVVLKTHVDVIEDFDDSFVKRLKLIAKKHSFLVMEDRKFGDIGNTVSMQYRKGVYKIAEWADIITAHPVAGPSIIAGLKNGLSDITEPRGVFLIAEMSCEDALTTGQYVKDAVAMAQNSLDVVAGLVCQSDIFPNPELIQLTPGVKIVESSDNLGQRYNTPATVVASGADLAVVGRGITEASDKLAATLRYKNELWMAYKKRIS